VEGVYLYPRSLHWSTNFLLAYVSSVLVWGFIQWPLIGWLVARAHRTHAAVLALTVGISRIFVAALSEIYYSFAGFHILKSLNDHPQFIFFIILALAQQIVLIVAGGLLVKPKTGPEQPLATIAHPAS